MYNSYGTFYHNGYSELYHHGVKGQKHGQRRWQNPDGSLTPEGYIHYGYAKRKIVNGKETTVYKDRALDKRERFLNKTNAIQDARYARKGIATTKQYNAAVWDATNSPAAKARGRKIMAAGVAITSVAASIALGTAVLAFPGVIPAAVVGSVATSRSINKNTTGIKKYREEKRTDYNKQ